MDWDDLRIFLAVARAGQFLGAANRLGLNHATVSRRIAGLEKALDARLLDRLATGCRLTEAGERLLPVAERMERDALDAGALSRERPGELSGVVRIGAPDGFGVGWLAPRLGALSESHPRLRIELVPVPRSISLSRREADLLVTVERPTEGRLVAARLVDYALGLYASRAYVARHGLPDGPGALGSHRLVGYVSDLLASPALDYGAEIAGSWAPSIAVSSALGQLAAVRAGAGIGILHRFLAAAEPELVSVPGFPLIRRAYWLVYPEALRGVPAIRAAAAFVTDQVAADRAAFA